MLQRYYVMVYGSLMEGKSNHAYMQSAQGEFIERVVSKEDSYDMYAINNSFPAIVEGGSSKFAGELYAVTGEGIVYVLDYLEGYPTLYDRKIIEVQGVESKQTYKAVVYIMSQDYANSMGVKESDRITFHQNTFYWN